MNKYNIDVTTYIIFIFLYSSIDKIVKLFQVYPLRLYEATHKNIKLFIETLLSKNLLKWLKINNYVEH